MLVSHKKNLFGHKEHLSVQYVIMKRERVSGSKGKIVFHSSVPINFIILSLSFDSYAHIVFCSLVENTYLLYSSL